jgi:hypothetical protein
MYLEVGFLFERLGAGAALPLTVPFFALVTPFCG